MSTFAAGDLDYIAKLNAIADNNVRATNASGTINVLASTVTTITFATEDWDGNALHSTSTNTGRLTAVVAGKYLVTGGINWSVQSPGTATFLLARLAKNGTAIEGARQTNAPISSMGTNGQAQIASAIVSLAIGDYVTLEAYQDSSGTLTVALLGSSLQMARVGA